MEMEMECMGQLLEPSQDSGDIVQQAVSMMFSIETLVIHQQPKWWSCETTQLQNRSAYGNVARLFLWRTLCNNQLPTFSVPKSAEQKKMTA
jgi:hypothetical protein|mmetsp:Transcript_6819/g.10393  ORF Transcript_6819/g.10393 Transcript_6819/m.10393 type:complete len:91 (+) Transcript_6819:451-723(+)